MNVDLDSFIEEGEGALEAIESNTLLHEIPIAGRFLKIIKSARDLRDRMFVAKLAKFLQHPELNSDRAREQMRKEATASPEKAKHVGETLFLVLERVTDMQKPTWLAAMFAAYLAGDISANDWRRSATAIDSAFADDVASLLEIPDDDRIQDHQQLKAALLPSGLSYLLPITVGGGPTFAISPLALLIRDAVKKNSPR